MPNYITEQSVLLEALEAYKQHIHNLYFCNPTVMPQDIIDGGIILEIVKQLCDKNALSINTSLVNALDFCVAWFDSHQDADLSIEDYAVLESALNTARGIK